MEQINFGNHEIIMSVISREYIENQIFDDVMNLYDRMLEEPEKCEGKLEIIIQGYDHDKRELFEIQEIRDYFFTLDKLFPYWFYFIRKTSDNLRSSLKLIMMLLVPVKISFGDEVKQTIEFDIDKYEEFMRFHFHYLNELTDKMGLSLEENKRISFEVLSQFQ